MYFTKPLSLLLVSLLVSSCGSANTKTVQDGRLNRLAKEASPYLKQHADNPVDWYPWGQEALQRAKKEDKPILLSVGYSACHWCHVMEHESFSDPDVAKIMNSNFINIKVDREERPDIDAIYMKALTKMTGGGGWPLTVFMTPDLKPFFAGTYFPKENKIGQPSFKKVLNIVIKGWREDRKEIDATSNHVLSMLSKDTPVARKEAPKSSKAIKEGVETLLYYKDAHWGGLGHSTKFPFPTVLDLFMRIDQAKLSNIAEEKRQSIHKYITLTLNKMAQGGIHDQIGGGFCRYSTDSKWLIPHFEKMLYDNAMMPKCYLNGYKITKSRYWANVARDSIDFVLRDLAAKEGYFYSSLDADSEGKEGKFYVFSESEIASILDDSDAQFALSVYGVEKEGNFEEDKSVLHLKEVPEVLAQKKGMSTSVFSERLESINRKLLAYRNKRVHPRRDEKMLTGWNALMVSTLVSGYSTLEEDRYLEAAKKCMNFILSNELAGNDLYRTYKDGKPGVKGFLDDYAYAIQALLDLVSVDGDPKWLEAALKLNEAALEKFYNSKTGLFYLTEAQAPDLVYRARMDRDGSTPSATSVSVFNQLRFARLLNEPRYLETANEVLSAYGQLMVQKPADYSNLLAALTYRDSSKSEIVLAVDRKSSTWQEANFKIGDHFLPNTSIVTYSVGNTDLEKRVGLLASKVLIGKKSTFYLCKNYACKAPINDPDKLDSQLKSIEK